MFLHIKPKITLLFLGHLPSPPLHNEGLFNYFMSLPGEVYRDMPTRTTSKINLDGKLFFIKKHHGVGWREILKNLLTFKIPVVSAETEFNALKKLQTIGISTTPAVALGILGQNPAKKKSFLITQDLGNFLTLEDLTLTWSCTPPDRSFKKSLIKRVALLVRNMHANGLIHRDLYICHFCLMTDQLEQTNSPLTIMDLHRAQLNPWFIHRKRDKDLSALYFSAMHIGLTKRDIYTFLVHYFNCSLREALSRKCELNWINQRALMLDKKFKKKIKAGYKL